MEGASTSYSWLLGALDGDEGGASTTRSLSHGGRQLLASGRVLNVGIGVFVIAFFGTACILACLIGSRLKKPAPVYFVSAIIFGIVCAFMFGSPRGDYPDEPPEGFDQTYAGLIVLIVLMSVGALFALIALLFRHLIQTVYARPLSYHADVLRGK